MYNSIWTYLSWSGWRCGLCSWIRFILGSFFLTVRASGGRSLQFLMGSPLCFLGFSECIWYHPNMYMRGRRKPHTHSLPLSAPESADLAHKSPNPPKIYFPATTTEHHEQFKTGFRRRYARCYWVVCSPWSAERYCCKGTNTNTRISLLSLRLSVECAVPSTEGKCSLNVPQ